MRKLAPAAAITLDEIEQRRSRRHRTRQIATIALALVVSLIGTSILVRAFDNGDKAVTPAVDLSLPSGADGAALTGDALAESLGLTKLPEKPDDCMNYVEVDDPAGYCIEDVVHNFQESWTLGRLLRDMPIGDVDRQIARLTEELSRTDSGSERYQEVLAQIEALNQERADEGGK
jgi:hypothetical protein